MLCRSRTLDDLNKRRLLFTPLDEVAKVVRISDVRTLPVVRNRATKMNASGYMKDTVTRKQQIIGLLMNHESNVNYPEYSQPSPLHVYRHISHQ